jgi:zinc transport system permease protein
VSLPWPFDREYMQLALAAGLVVGACAPLIGTFLVQKRMSLMGDGLGHLAFAGVAGALLLGVWPLWGALLFTVIGALGIEWLRSRRRASGDLALAVAFYVGIATGVVLLTLGGSLNTNVFGFLFGQILLVTPSEVAAVAVLGAVIVVAFLVARRALFATVGDEEWASVAGLPVGALNGLLAVLTAIIVVAAMRVVGLLLIAALMVLPVAAGQLVARSFRGTLVWSSAIGAGSVLAGLVAARAWGLAASGTIVLIAALVFGVVAATVGLRRRLTGNRPEQEPPVAAGLGDAVPRGPEPG